MSRQYGHHLLSVFFISVILNRSCSAFFIATTSSAITTAARPGARPTVPARMVKIGDRLRNFYFSRPHDQAVGAAAAPSPRNGSDNSSDGDGVIDLNSAMANARANLAAGTSPGAGLESAFDQADAAFADLIVTSIDSQGIGLDDEDVEELAKGGSMDETSTSKRSKGLFGDMSDVFGALSGGAHIVKREDGTV
ncbi:unnamed protein product [Pylaiella littoralis]